MPETHPEHAPGAGLKVLVVGGGLSGMASALALRQAGHDVTVFERMPELKEIGAGIQLPPNATRLLERWGVLDEVRKHAFQPETGALRSDEGAIIARSPPGAVVERIYKIPFLVIHRADLLKVLESAAVRHGVEIKLGCEVASIDFSHPSLRLATGAVYDADVILGADGERSLCRSALLGRPDPPESTGDVVFRIAVARNDIAEGHPSWELMQRASVNVWMGPGAHGVSYLLKDDILNVVLVHSDDKPDKNREVMPGPQRADLNELKALFSGWDPALRGLLEVSESDCTMWTLMQINEVTNWSHPGGRFVLTGDAAHAILPYLAQGAAQAFEDAGVLGAIFERLTDRNQVADALRVFEQVRRPRAAEVRKRTLAQKATYGLCRGPAQEERDAKLSLGPVAGSPNALADPIFQGWLWGYDAGRAGLEAWETHVKV